jgi:alpha-tubulin suppressor-like RCC1 family protein
MRKSISVIVTLVLTFSSLVALSTAAKANVTPQIEAGIGNNHMVSLDSQGRVWTWGVLRPGQSGSNSAVVQSEPIQVIPSGGPSAYIDVDATCGSSVAVGSNGSVWAWGNSGNGLGDSATTSSTPYTSPVRVAIPAGKQIVKVSADDCGFAAIASDGSLFQWGSGWYLNRSTPVLTMSVPVPSDLSTLDVFKIGWANVFVRSGSDVYAQGDASSGKLGNGSTSNSWSGSYPARTQVSVPAGKTFTKISGNSQFAIARASDGTVWGWGGNDLGQIDGKRRTSTSVAFSTVPIQIHPGSTMLGSIVDVSVTDSEPFVTALRSNGTAVSWGGWNNDNMVLHEVDRMGDSTVSNTRTATKLWGSSGAYLAASSDGTLWARGYRWWEWDRNNTVSMDGNCGQDATDWPYWDERKRKMVDARPLVRVSSQGQFGPTFLPDSMSIDSLSINGQSLSTTDTPSVTLRQNTAITISMTGVTSNCFDAADLELSIASGISSAVTPADVSGDGTVTFTTTATTQLSKSIINVKLTNPNGYSEEFPVRFTVLPPVVTTAPITSGQTVYPIIYTNPGRNSTFAINEDGSVYVWGPGVVAKRFLTSGDPVGLPKLIDGPLWDSETVKTNSSVKIKGITSIKKWCVSNACGVTVYYAWGTDGRIYVLRDDKFIASGDYQKGNDSVLAGYFVEKMAGSLALARPLDEDVLASEGKTLLEFVRYSSSQPANPNNWWTTDGIPNYKWEKSRLVGDPDGGVTASISDVWSAGGYENTIVFKDDQDNFYTAMRRAAPNYRWGSYCLDNNCTSSARGWGDQSSWINGPASAPSSVSSWRGLEVKNVVKQESTYYMITGNSANNPDVLKIGNKESLATVSLGSGVYPVSLSEIEVGRYIGGTYSTGIQVLGSNGQLYAVTKDRVVTAVPIPIEIGGIKSLAGSGYYSIANDGAIWTTPTDEMLSWQQRPAADGNCKSPLVSDGWMDSGPARIVSDGNLGPVYSADRFGFNITSDVMAIATERDDLSSNSRTVALRPSSISDVNLFAYGTSACNESEPVSYSWDLEGDGTYEPLVPGQAVSARANSFIEKETGNKAGVTPTNGLSMLNNGWTQSNESIRVDSAEGHEVMVKVTSDYGSKEYRVAVVGTPKPAVNKRVGVTINSAARYTTSNDVELTVTWPDGAVQALISNDGGFDNATQVPLTESIRWKLDADESSKSTAVVYLRFLGLRLDEEGNWKSDEYEAGGVPITLSDNITADLTPPEVTSISATTAALSVMSLDVSAKAKMIALAEVGQLTSVTINAIDEVSGITSMQVTNDPATPGSILPYSSTASVSAFSDAVSVRLRDAAGNWSPWSNTTIGNFAVNPPTVNPPTVNPPIVNPPTVNPPTVNPPTVNAPAANPPAQQSPPTAVPSVAKAKKKLTVKAKTAAGLPVVVTVSGACKVKANTKTVKSKVGKKTVKTKTVVSYSVTFGKKNSSCTINQRNSGSGDVAPLNASSTVQIK